MFFAFVTELGHEAVIDLVQAPFGVLPVALSDEEASLGFARFHHWERAFGLEEMTLLVHHIG